MVDYKSKIFGVGIGLRRENSADMVRERPGDLGCLEIAPENYLHTGGQYFRDLKVLSEQYPIIVHGLSLSVGSLKPFNVSFLKGLKSFLNEFKARWMSDHLCYSSVLGSQLHDLLPLPMTKEAVDHAVDRVKFLQDFLEMPFAVENISCYAHAGEPEMTEWEFVSQVAEGADCPLLLDVNNIYVNSVNFGFNPYEYLQNIPLERVIHVHVAGHKQMDGYLLDTHGEKVIDPVWDLLGFVAARTKLPAVIIERDNNIPPLANSLEEARHAGQIIQQAHLSPDAFPAKDLRPSRSVEREKAGVSL